MYNRVIVPQAQQYFETNLHMSQKNKEEELLLQNLRVRTLQQAEDSQKRMRFEWRKSLDQGYNKDIQAKNLKAREEKKEYLDGPTTLKEL